MSSWEMEGKPALIILHMQQGIVGEKGNIPGLYEEVKAKGVIPRQQALLKAFRDRGLLVIYVNALHVNKSLNVAGILPAYGNLFRIIESTEAIPNTLEVIPELAPQPGEPVLTNWIIGAFNNSGLEQVLTAYGAATLVMVGCATQIAVYTAALQAVDRCYSVVIPGDACASAPTQLKAQEVVLEMMAPNIALVTSTEDVIAHL